MGNKTEGMHTIWLDFTSAYVRLVPMTHRKKISPTIIEVKLLTEENTQKKKFLLLMLYLLLL